MTGSDIRVGGYTSSMGGTAEGISLLRWEADGAGLEIVGTTPTFSPSFLAAGAGGLLYCTDEHGTDEHGTDEYDTVTPDTSTPSAAEPAPS